MEQETHKKAAEIHYNFANDCNAKFEASESNEKKAYMVVAAQNYFYCIINLIELQFAKTDEHSFNHENRYRKLTEKSSQFSAEFKKLFNEVDRDLRNKVAYRGQNGKKYASIKKLAELAMIELLQIK